jgi:excisionase family DNA binding protein
MSEQHGGKWLTVDDVATQLQVSQETVRRWIRSGKLPVLDLGGPKAGYRIREDVLEEFIAERYGHVAKTAA